MIIVPTRQCNTNNCNYCGIHKNDFKIKYFNDFSLSEFYKRVLHISKITNDYDLRFFGGEPFLRINIIKQIITYFRSNTNDFNFIINTNLTILSDDILSFLKDKNIKLIISCNGDLNSHSKTRGITYLQTIELYKNIKKVISYDIDYQLNIVTQNETVNRLHDNFLFMYNELGLTNFNLLPVSYNGWNKDSINQFEIELNKVRIDIEKKILKINFINKEINNEVLLFNSEVTIDSDGMIYPSMVIMEKFFTIEKKNILITNLQKEFSEFKKDFLYWSDDLNNIYSIYINKVLNKKFSNIVEGDNRVSEIFGNFLKKI